MIRQNTFTLVVLLGVFSTTNLWAEENRFMSRFDSNHDGIITQDEFNHNSEQRFTNMDKDKDGLINQKEFSDYTKTRRQNRMMKFMDKDNNGQISQDEFVAAEQKRAERKFKKLDTNNDNTLNEDELKASKRYDKQRFSGIFSKMDMNEDGNVTRQESINAWNNWFTRLDLNKDGSITSNEVISMRKKRFEEHRMQRNQEH
ncbi:MAG: EF-hand domain-containing protein [Gammaproteobacteria bacterium]|nr:EF-hand domain-containing protein [Gammaproteobacteria bacterium]